MALSRTTLEPDWIVSLRQAGLENYERLGFPTRKLEAWKNVDLRPIFSTPFMPYDPVDESRVNREEIARHFLPETRNARLVFLNGQFSESLSTLDRLPDEVIVRDLKSAFAEYGDLIRPYLATPPDSGQDAFTSLNTAHFGNGVFVYVPDDILLESPVQVLFYATGNDDPRVAYNRGLFIAGRNSRLRIVVQFAGSRDATYLGNTVLELVAQEKARIDYIAVQAEAKNAFGFLATQARLEAGSQVLMNTVALTGHTCRHHAEIHFLGEEAYGELNGLSVLNGETKVYHHTQIHHRQPRCQSRQIYKGILDGQSRCEFDGTIVVHRDAQQTDAQQLNKNLLLSENAQVFTRPQLRIDADDVKCAHGATVGQLNPDELFYLASRGLSQEVARCMLTFAFAEDLVTKLALPGLQNYLNGFILENLEQVEAPLGCFTRCGDCKPEHQQDVHR